MNEIIIIVATYGAVLSTVVFIFQLIENWKRMKVELSGGVVPGLTENESKVMMLSGSNISKRPINLTSYSLWLPDGRWFFFVNRSPDKIPKTLADGDGVTMWIPLKDLAIALKKEGLRGNMQLKGFFKDASGKYYNSKKKLNFNIDEWLKG